MPKSTDIFLVSPKNMLLVLLEVPLGGASNEYPQHIFFVEK